MKHSNQLGADQDILAELEEPPINNYQLENLRSTFEGLSGDISEAVGLDELAQEIA